TSEHFGVQDQVDIYFATFAKSMAGIGAFVASQEHVIRFLAYNMRSQIFAKSLPMAMVLGIQKRLEILKSHPELRENLWNIAGELQKGLREIGFDLGRTQSPVTPVYMFGGIPEAANMIFDLRENFGVFCSMVVYPVVPKGQIMLRLIPTAAHTLNDVKETVEAFRVVRDRLAAGKYNKEKIAQF
ncbi:MAG TPA: aminotransferase class I/II-fold pyridoxal phosphate-dependent enzyme, partial [Tenuifilaceae bacterium]|nr:aminotransferase class I/II-fold pyridoxal phosphate-dependent enzyme [Tenuifilaceae bacterium]